MSENVKSKGYAARDASGELSPWEFERRPVGDDDILIDIKYASVCHSDIHQITGDWGEQQYPQVPGHEMTGIVTQVGANVTDFKVGDRAGVGCMVNGNPSCKEYQEGYEQYCSDTKMTYGWPEEAEPTGITQGGYASNIVVNAHFAVSIPESIGLDDASPLLCAGVTTFAPLMRAKVGADSKVAVVGIGGLGHMAIKLAIAQGAEVYGFTTSPDKIDDITKFGAKAIVVSDDQSELADHAATFDFVISTIPNKYDITPYASMAKPHCTFTQVGMGEGFAIELNNFAMAVSRVQYEASLIGGMPETQEVVNFCAENEVTPQIQMIDRDEVNEAWRNVKNKQARYRYVMDMSDFTAEDA